MCSLSDIFDVLKWNSDLPLIYGDIIISAEHFIRLRGFFDEDGVVDWLLENGFTADSVMFEYLFGPPPPLSPPYKKQSAFRANARPKSHAQYGAPGTADT